jgi:hypothetical protein
MAATQSVFPLRLMEGCMLKHLGYNRMSRGKKIKGFIAKILKYPFNDVR